MEIKELLSGMIEKLKSEDKLNFSDLTHKTKLSILELVIEYADKFKSMPLVENESTSAIFNLDDISVVFTSSKVIKDLTTLKNNISNIIVVRTIASTNKYKSDLVCLKNLCNVL